MISAFARTGFEVFVLNKIRNYFLIKELSSYLSKHQKHLTIDLKTRIESYTYIASIPNLWFSGLRGYPPGKDEILANRYLGACTPVFDDLTDSGGYSFHKVLNAIEDNKGNMNESLLLLRYFNEKINEKAKNPDLFRHYLEKTTEAQMMSIRQKGSSKLTHEEIRDITYKKGGYATLLFRSLLSNKPVANEEEAIYHLGALLQMMNDIFDIYEDHRNGLQTLASVTNDINLLKHEYIELIDKTIILFRNLDYHPKRIRKTLDKIITVISRGCVCLNQLLALQGDKGNFDAGNFTRGDLICDMEKISNIRRSLAISKEIKRGQPPY